MANGDNIFGETSGVNLTAVVNPINLNPLDIFGKDYSGKFRTAITWNDFQFWLRNSASPILINLGILNPGQRILNNPILNSRNTGKPISDRLIQIYNDTSPRNLITPEDIQNIQLFHKKINPNVQVDQWVGSQTTQLLYPLPKGPFARVNNNNPENGPIDFRAQTRNNQPTTLPYFPVIWGNKRFIISRENYDKGVINDPPGSKTWISPRFISVNDYILYTDRYKNQVELRGYPEDTPWDDNFFKGPTITQSPNQVNQQTQQQQQQNNKSIQTTQAVNNITQPPR
jgi:hypothetical protein